VADVSDRAYLIWHEDGVSNRLPIVDFLCPFLQAGNFIFGQKVTQNKVSLLLKRLQLFVREGVGHGEQIVTNWRILL
jgi:hypothetical protein